MLFLHTITLRALIYSWLHVHICVRQKLEEEELGKVLILYKANLDLCKTKEEWGWVPQISNRYAGCSFAPRSPFKTVCHYLSLATENFLPPMALGWKEPKWLPLPEVASVYDWLIWVLKGLALLPQFEITLKSIQLQSSCRTGWGPWCKSITIQLLPLLSQSRFPHFLTSVVLQSASNKLPACRFPSESLFPGNFNLKLEPCTKELSRLIRAPWRRCSFTITQDVGSRDREKAMRMDEFE